MSLEQDWLIKELKPLKFSISSGMRLASKDALKMASPTGRREPGDKTELRAYVYRRDSVLKMTGIRNGPGNGGAVRGEIRGFTHQSRRRLTHLARNTADLWTGFVTLTYPADFPTNGRETKRHLNAFCSWLRRQKVAYVWILEFQERGAPHFHFLVSGWLDKDEVARRWTAIVNPLFPSEREKMLKSSTRVEGVKNPDQVGGYLGAYMSKLDQKQVPKNYKHVGRFWGASRAIYRIVLEPGSVQKFAVAHLRADGEWDNRFARIKPGTIIHEFKGEPLNPKRLYRLKGLYADASRALRIYRRWYARHCASGSRGIGFKWKWRGQGFVLCDGTPLFNQMLRQSVMIDAGRDVWKEWDGEKDKAAVFLSPVDRLNMQGQMLIDGGFAPTFEKYDE